VIILAATLQMLAYLPGRCNWPAAGRGMARTAGQLVTLARLRCGGRAALCPGAALIMGLGFGDIRVFECVAYVPAVAVIILAASFLTAALNRGWALGIWGLPVGSCISSLNFFHHNRSICYYTSDKSLELSISANFIPARKVHPGLSSQPPRRQGNSSLQLQPQAVP